MDLAGLEREESVVRAARSGDREAFEKLFRRFYAPVYSICLRVPCRAEEAHDLTLETFLRAYRSIDRFDPTRQISNWLFRIATNLTIDHLRKKSRRPEIDDAEEAAFVPDEPFGCEDLARIQTAVGKLPPIHRAVVVLHFQPKLRGSWSGKSFYGGSRRKSPEIRQHSCGSQSVRVSLSAVGSLPPRGSPRSKVRRISANSRLGVLTRLSRSG